MNGITGVTIWNIGRVLTGPYTEETQKMHDKYPSFIEKWGGRCRTIHKVTPERFKTQVPDDIAAAREVPKIYSMLGPNVLIEAYERRDIINLSTRRDIDRLYTRLGGGRVAPRHP